jgi:hypothetical protein
MIFGLFWINPPSLSRFHFLDYLWLSRRIWEKKCHFQKGFYPKWKVFHVWFFLTLGPFFQFFELVNCSNLSRKSTTEFWFKIRIPMWKTWVSNLKDLIEGKYRLTSKQPWCFIISSTQSPHVVFLSRVWKICL